MVWKSVDNPNMMLKYSQENVYYSDLLFHSIIGLKQELKTKNVNKFKDKIRSWEVHREWSEIL